MDRGGYYTDKNGIEHYWPQDDSCTIYIMAEYNMSLADILERAREEWPDVDPANIAIEAEHLRTCCLGYDRYDSFDYTNFIILRRNPPRS